MASHGEKIMKPYLRKLLREHRALNRMIDTTKSIGGAEDVKTMKRDRLRIRDKITLLERHNFGRGLPG